MLQRAAGMRCARVSGRSRVLAWGLLKGASHLI